MAESSTNNCDTSQLDERYSMEIDMAWDRKNYIEVLSKLQNDEIFPINFKLEELNEEHEDQKKLKLFAEERNRLHEWIKEGKLKEIMEYVSNTKLEYYINTDDRSAAFTAIDNKKFEIYAYLKSVGVKLKETEMNVIMSLTDLEKFELGDEMRSYFPTNEKSHVLYLISKSKPNSQNHSNFQQDIKNYFEKLNTTPEISTILKVNQYVHDLEIFFDFDHDNVQDIFPPASSSTKGLALHYQGSIYIGAGGGKSENEILGTMAHEFTHLAMDLIFNNDTKPFIKSDFGKEKEFKEILDKCTNVKKNENDGPSMILTAVFGYPVTERQCELIVRVPHILMEYKDKGKLWLLKNTPDLYEFYEKSVLPECEKCISENFLLKPRSFIRHLNETEGEVRNIEKCGLRFKNVEKLANFLSDPDKSIFLIITKNTWIGLLRIYQAVQEVFHKSHDSFLILKFENFLNNFGDVEYFFHSKVLDLLIIECSDILNGRQKVLEIVKTIEEKTSKQIVFVVKDGMSKNWKEIIEEAKLANAFKEMEDEDLSVSELNDNSREKILGKAIIFQGREMKLGNLVNNDEDLLNSLNADIIGKLLKNKKIEIAGKPLGTSDLDGTYADIFHEINLSMLVEEIKNGNDIVVVDGITESDKKRKFNEYLQQDFDNSIFEELADYHKKISSGRKIFLTDCETSDRSFKLFCSFISEKKVYLIDKKLEDKVTFMLKKIYNPNFYFKREFFAPFCIDKENLRYLSYFDKKTKIIIVSKEKPEFSNPNVDWQDSENNFEELSESYKIVHLLKRNDDKLIWVKSHGSLSNLRQFVIKESMEKILGEDELIREIIKRSTVIFADDPGMGKSTTLTKLYENKFVADTHWVMRINLRNHIEAIKSMICEIITLENVNSFLKEINSTLNNNFSWNLLNSALDKNKIFPKPLLLAFDGFDELLDKSDRNKVIDLLKFLKENTKCKIWITTRVHFRNILEDELSTFEVRLVPISDPSKELFVKNYIKNRFKLVLSPEKFNEVSEEDGNYTKSFLESIKIIFQGNVERFIGTPLQLYLLLEGSIESFLNWIHDTNGNPDFSYLGSNIFEVFKKFFSRKYDIYFRKKGIIEETRLKEEKTNHEICHELLAVGEYLTLRNIYETIAPQMDPVLIARKEVGLELPARKKPSIFTETKQKKEVKTINYEKFREVVAVMQCQFIIEDSIPNMSVGPLLLIGIINEEFEFSHFTFREYFFARWLLKFLGEKRKIRKDSVIERYIAAVLTQDGYQTTRTFINFMLKSLKEKRLFNNPHKTNFIKAVVMKKYEEIIFHVPINEANNDLFTFLFRGNFSLSEYASLLKYTDSDCRTILHSAIYTGNEYIFNLIIEVVSKLPPADQIKLLNATNNYGRTVLDSTIETGNIDFVKKILKIAEEISFNEIFQLVSKSHGLRSVSSLERAAEFGHFEIFKFVFEKMLEFASDQQIRNFFDPDCRDKNIAEKGLKVLLLSSNRSQIEIFKYIFQKANSILDKELHFKLFNSIWSKLFKLFNSIGFPNFDAVKYLVETAEEMFPDKENDLLFKKNIALFFAAEKNCSYIIKMLFEMTELDSFYQIISMEDVTGQNVLQCAIKRKHFEIVKLILEKVPPEKQYEILCRTDHNHQNALHFGCITGNTEIVKLIIPDAKDEASWEKQYALMCMKDRLGRTPLHLAVFYHEAQVVKILIEKLKRPEELKKYLTQRDSREDTPLDYATKWHDSKISSIISEALNS